MKYLILSVVVLSTFPVLKAQQTGHSMPGHKPENRAELATGMGSHHHPVSTKNPEAQKFFDQGLSYIFAFNHDEAIKSFRRAAELDPEMAMAHWGIAYALGPNINLDVDPAREKAAFEATQKALSLAAKAPQNERDYIEALAKRYSIDPKADLKKLAVDFKVAMGELVKRYPDDLDLATLYAESAMNLKPWKLWEPDGKPAEGTEEIVAVLESVLRRNPNHAGAIHYYIHAIEASPNPERALAYAPKLSHLMPAAGHLVHMPSHIYHLTGDYDAAAKSNVDAALADEAYIKANGLGGVYPLMYYTHNLHFLAIAHSLQGRLADAKDATTRLENHVGPHVAQMPMLEGFLTVRPFLLVQFHQWDEISKASYPSQTSAVAASWHFARGMAHDAKGRRADAVKAYEAMLKEIAAVPADLSFGLNNARNILKIAALVLESRLAKADNKDRAVELMRQAVAMDDALAFEEPPSWFTPARIWLGGMLMSNGDHAAAEQVFRADLQRNKRSGRSLFGLYQSLKAQKKDLAAAMVQKEFQEAWKNADTQMRLEDFGR